MPTGGSSNFHVNSGSNPDRGSFSNNTPWRLVPEAGATWLSNFAPMSANEVRNITFDFTQNTGAERQATLTVSNTDTGSPISHTITVIQSGCKYPRVVYAHSFLSFARHIEHDYLRDI